MQQRGPPLIRGGQYSIQPRQNDAIPPPQEGGGGDYARERVVPYTLRGVCVIRQQHAEPEPAVVAFASSITSLTRPFGGVVMASWADCVIGPDDLSHHLFSAALPLRSHDEFRTSVWCGDGELAESPPLRMVMTRRRSAGDLCCLDHAVEY